ncbi:class I SAM-dependent DNA methyltransferase [Algoriphagus sp. A40]|uniref:class I SAM-dependent DNA methyltransferase n=1 Tax=Algoriphagus sp. A40 TaxID=1945863 RepID=UPI0009862943|nr:class I SAM-dependent DNA methyltransferase [Algoriphagus sp. A40]OOG76456.1 DNA methyltransferase [Algoriphagus sp. A40]
MTTNNLISKIWSFCDTLRDDGLGYNDYLEQLTFLLFLKMADENQSKYNLPEIYEWQTLKGLNGGELQDKYEQTLLALAESGGMLKKIFSGARNKIHDSSKLKKLINLIDDENWSSTEVDIKGEIYESLLQKNAENSGAGQYFTPRPVIRAMVECMQPKPGETIADPSCGTGGFFLGALEFLDTLPGLSEKQKDFIKFDMFHGWEIENATARLCLMNLYLHGIGDLEETPDILVTDSLKYVNENGKAKEHFDIVLANPPFGKSSSDVPTIDEEQAKKEGYFYRRDFWATTSNKQLSFLQHIASMLNENGRAAVVLPDNVLFEGGAGETIRKELLKEMNLHTILRLPTGIFYAPGVKSNVLFFEKKESSKEIGTDEIWFYDYRTNVHPTPKKNPLTFNDLKDFIRCYQMGQLDSRKETWSDKNSEGRWRKYTYDDIMSRDKTNMDIFWLRDASVIDLDNLPEPEVLLDEIIENIESALAGFRTIKDSLG